MDWLDQISRVSGRTLPPDLICSPACSPPATRCCTSATPARPPSGSASSGRCPSLGPLLYLVLGVNRIRRRAVQLGVHKTFSRHVPGKSRRTATRRRGTSETARPRRRPCGGTAADCPETRSNRSSTATKRFPRCSPRLNPPKNPFRSSATFSTTTRPGNNLSPRLNRAVQRGVEVRVLMDAAGTRYSWPPITHVLRRAKIPVCEISAVIPAATMARRHHQSPQPPQDPHRGRPDRLSPAA